MQPNNRLTEERLSRLENINFAWSAKRRRSPSIPGSKWPSLDERLLRKYDEQWDEFYGRLAKYKATYGVSLLKD